MQAELSSTSVNPTSSLPSLPAASSLKSAQRARMRHANAVRLAEQAQERIKGMSREQAIKHVERLLKKNETPVQYHAALISQLSELNMWKRSNDDGKSRIAIDEMVNGWKREDAGEYAGIMNSAIQCSVPQVRSDNGAICQPLTGGPDVGAMLSGASTPHACPTCACARAQVEAQAASVAGAATGPGGSPQAESRAEALDPLTRRDSPEKPLLTSDSKGVTPIQPTDMWEEE